MYICKMKSFEPQNKKKFMDEKDIKINSMLRRGAVLHDTYRIDDYLSSGGFGNTYVAANIQFDEVVAIKEFFMSGVTERDANSTTVSVSNAENKQQFQEQLEKFKKEARRLRRFNNPHIVRVHDLFEENGTAYYVMDYIKGQNLSERLKTTGSSIDEVDALNYFSQILDALAIVHQDGIYHMDIKPGNIMVDTDGVARLIDFGASKQFDSKGSATTSTSVSYTNGYAPCEQMEQNKDKFGAWTDIYSLGATLYNLLTNRKPPMPSDINDDRTDDKHLALPMPGITPHTQNLIRSMMSYSFMDRPKSTDEVKKMLESHQDIRIEEIGDDHGEETELGIHGGTTPYGPQKPEPKPDVQPKRRDNSWAKGAIIATITALVIAGIAFGIHSSHGSTTEDTAASDTTLGIQMVENQQMTVKGGTITYTGPVNAKRMPEGIGKAKYNDGTYNGPFVDGVRSGDNATFVYSTNGDKFSGSYSDDHFERGRYTFIIDGQYYEGTFRIQADGNPDFKNGTLYEKDGTAICKYTNGEESEL